jgi:hypothetical protein
MKKLFPLLAIALTAIVLFACTPESTATAQINPEKASEQARKTSVHNAMQATPAPVLERSLDRDNIAKRLTRSNDANHIQWMYLIADSGVVIERFAVRGKVTSGGKRLNRDQELKKVEHDCGEWMCDSVITLDAPDEMGTFGSSGDYIFWFDLEDNLVQTNMKYITLDKPVNIKSGTLRISDVDEKELREKRAIEEALNKGVPLNEAVKSVAR